MAAATIATPPVDPALAVSSLRKALGKHAAAFLAAREEYDAPLTPVGLLGTKARAAHWPLCAQSTGCSYHASAAQVLARAHVVLVQGLCDSTKAHQQDWLREHATGARRATLVTSNLIRAADTMVCHAIGSTTLTSSRSQHPPQCHADRIVVNKQALLRFLKTSRCIWNAGKWILSHGDRSEHTHRTVNRASRVCPRGQLTTQSEYSGAPT